MKNKLRILLLSATMFLSLNLAFAQSHLAVTAIINYPDTAHCLVPYSGIQIDVKNMRHDSAFSGGINIQILDNSGVHTILTVDTVTIDTNTIDTLSFVLNNYFFNTPEYAAGHDVVIVWPIALNGITVSDTFPDSTYVICTSGIPDYKEKKEFSLYPDPANDMFYIKSDYTSNDIDYIKMMDIEGKELNRFSSSQTMIPVNDLERGMYFIEIILKNGESITSKFVKD